MATATVTPAEAVDYSRPHLGDFHQVFETVLRLTSEPDRKLRLERKPSPVDERHKSRERAQIRKAILNAVIRRRPNDPHADHTGRTLGVLSLDPPLDLAESGLYSPTSSSDATLASADSLRYSTPATTPPGSAEKAAGFPSASSPPSFAFDNDPSIPGRDGFVFTPSRHHTVAGTPRRERHHIDSRVPVAGVEPLAPPPAFDGSIFRHVPWSPSRFRYTALPIQPYKGVKLYGVICQNSREPLVPRYLSTKDDKEKVLTFKLAPALDTDRALRATSAAASRPIHVFVDLSNITIGFYDCLKLMHGVPVGKKIKAPPFSFEHLALVLERGRPTGKKIVAGSLVNAYHRKWPEYMQEAKDLGYEMNILQRVPKASPVSGQSPSRKKGRRGHGDVAAEWATSSAESSGEEAQLVPLKQGEQGVDEILHLKMLQSALDSEPATVVLATGDAAAAEYSDGFKKNVERLLQSGWNVEIIGWSKGISSAWRDHAFAKAWGNRVRLVELDAFVEEFYAAWFCPGK